MQIVYEVLSGSHAYGLATETADEDIRGIFLPSANEILGFGYKETVEAKPDKVWHSLKKFLGLALKANPSILAWLWVEPEFIRHQTHLSVELRNNRERFLSKLVHKTFGGYATSQLKKMQKSVGGDEGYAMHGERDASKNGSSLKAGYDAKNAMHLMRLLYCGVSLLRDCYYPVYVEDSNWHNTLKEIRAGEWPINLVLHEAKLLFNEMDEALQYTDLPEEPDRKWAERFLCRWHYDTIVCSSRT